MSKLSSIEDMLENGAIVTRDGEIVRIGNHIQQHPVYKTPAIEIDVYYPLSYIQKGVFDVLYLRDTEELRQVHRGTRSSIDQLSIFGGEFSTTEFSGQDAGGVYMTTLVTGVNGQKSERMLATLKKLIKEGLRPKFGRLLLAPEESYCDQKMIPIEQSKLEINITNFNDRALEEIWLGEGSGRSNIEANRKHMLFTDEIKPLEYLLGEVQGMAPNDPHLDKFWVISRMLRDRFTEEKTSVRHGDAVIFDPYRSKGIRQIEVYNTDEHKIYKPSELDIKVKMFKCNFQHSSDMYFDRV
jgi:hypothetical protein